MRMCRPDRRTLRIVRRASWWGSRTVVPRSSAASSSTHNNLSMSWSPAAVPRDGQSQVEIVHELPYVPTKFKPSLATLSISPTRVGVHHGHWKAAPPEEMVGSRHLVRIRVGRSCGKLQVTSLPPAMVRNSRRGSDVVRSRGRRDRGSVQQVQHSCITLRSESYRSMEKCCTCCTEPLTFSLDR